MGSPLERSSARVILACRGGKGGRVEGGGEAAAGEALDAPGLFVCRSVQNRAVWGGFKRGVV